MQVQAFPGKFSFLLVDWLVLCRKVVAECVRVCVCVLLFFPKCLRFVLVVVVAGFWFHEQHLPDLQHMVCIPS